MCFSPPTPPAVRRPPHRNAQVPVGSSGPRVLLLRPPPRREREGETRSGFERRDACPALPASFLVLVEHSEVSRIASSSGQLPQVTCVAGITFG
jgi:hypothetical protein